MSTQPKVAIVIIHYNTPQYLESCLDAIFAQTYKDIEVIFLDNDSPGKEGLEYMRAHYADRENLRIIANKDNLGYALAANQGIRMAIEGMSAVEAAKPAKELKDYRKPADFKAADYVVITNPDIIYTPEYFETIIPRIEKDEKIAAITGKVLKYDFDRKKPTNIIDTVGLMAYKNRRVIDDGQGLIDEGQFEQEQEVFGVSGACPLYRREALEDVKVLGEYLDEDFFMYKEDVDISWRFLLYGWKCYYYPKAVAYHGRGTGIFRRFFNRQILENRSKLSKFQRHYSFQNQHLMQVKNEMWGTFFADFRHIIFRKVLTPFYITLKEPFLWKSYFAYLKRLPHALKKRKIIMSKVRIKAKDIKKWFKKQSDYLKK